MWQEELNHLKMSGRGNSLRAATNQETLEAEKEGLE